MELFIKKEIEKILALEFKGWDFSWLDKRITTTSPTWDYRQEVINAIQHSTAMLDMGTGGGEFLLSLPCLPIQTKATEGYKPNVEVARENLSKVGIEVFYFDEDNRLPFNDNNFDLIINRHESFDEIEIKRILKPEGTFLTQQVGNFDNRELNRLFADASREDANWTLKIAEDKLEKAGFRVIEKFEEFLPCTFLDISSIIYYLNIISWQIPGLDLKSDRAIESFVRIKKIFDKVGRIDTLEHRFFIKAQAV